MILLIDNFDSFTYNLLDYFEQLGEHCHVVRNDVSLSDIQQLEFDKIVFSPGPGRADEVLIMQEVISAYKNELPILGVCLGHQAIGQYFGIRSIKADRPMHGKIDNILLKVDPLFDGLGEYTNVTRYHSLVLDPCFESKEIQAIAFDSKGQIMAIKHSSLSIRGVQFHPEAWLTESGMRILKNWLEFSNTIKSQ